MRLDISRPEEEKAELLEQLADQGCLIVRSAGNSAFRMFPNGGKPEEVNNLDDNLLRVAATGPVGMYASFTTTGEVSAPGTEVYTWGKGEVCGGRKGVYINGTSFSAPIVAGLATQVVGVLQHQHAQAWDQLSGPMRIQTINRILAASSLGGTVNALRAVLIAERWKAEMPQDVVSLKSLLSTQPPSFCTDSVPNTCLPGDGDCADRIRRILTACDTKPELYPKHACLVGAMAKSGNTENALHLFKIFEQRYPDKKDYAHALAKATWPEFRTKWSGSQSATTFLETTDSNRPQFLLRHLAESPDSVFNEALDLTLDSFDLGRRLLKRKIRGSEDDLAYLVDTIQLAASRVETDQMEAWMDSWLDGFLHSDNISFFPLLPIRLYSALIESSQTPSSLLSLAKNQEDTLTEFLNKEALVDILPIVYNEPSRGYYRDDRYYFEPEHLVEIVVRQKELIDSTFVEHGLLGLSALFVIDLVANDSGDFATSLEMMELESRQRQWTRAVRSDLVKFALYRMANHDSTNDPEYAREDIQNAVEEIGRNAVRPGFNYGFIPHEHEYYDYYIGSEYRSFIYSMLRRDLVELSLQDGRWIKEQEVLVGSLLTTYAYHISQHGFHFYSPSTYQIRIWTPTVMRTLSSNRFEQIEIDSPRRDYNYDGSINQTITSTIKNYADAIIRYGIADMDGFLLRVHYWYEPLCSMFAPYDRAYSSLEALIEYLKVLNTENKPEISGSAKRLLRLCYDQGEEDDNEN